jgi:hypothetical protein
MKRLIIEQSDDEFYTSHSDFQAITGMRDADFFQQALGIGRVPSTERLRQRLDEAAADGLIPLVFRSSQSMLKQHGVKVSGYADGLVPLEVDVFPQDNSNTRKEGVSRTYKNFDGYAPIAAYLGMEGWCLEVELRPGSQHGQAGFVVFIQRVIKAAHVLIEQEIVVRLDAAHDAEETRQVLAAAEKVHFLIKWNPRNSNELAWRDRVFSEGTVTRPRAGKRIGLLVVDEPMQVNGSAYPCKRIVRVIERTTDRHGQLLLTPDITLEGWWTDHSEFKTDLDLERLPSGKFATNALVMALGTFAYNILRAIGQMGLLGQFAPIRHPAKRRRIRTVIQELIYLAGRLISTGRRLILRFSRHCPVFAAFQGVYRQLVPAR